VNGHAIPALTRLRHPARIGAALLLLLRVATSLAAQQAPRRPRLPGAAASLVIDSLPPRSALTRRDSLDGLTLEALERLAIDSSPALAAARLEIARARGDRTGAALRQNPYTLVTADLLSPRSPQFGTTNGQWYVSVQQPIELGGKRARRIETADAIIATVSQQVADSVRRVLFAVRSGWIDVLAAREQLALAERTAATYDRLVTLDRERLRQQQVSGAEFARVEVARSQADLAREDVTLALRGTETALATLVARAPRVPLRDSLAPFPELRDSLADIEALALATRADLRAARQYRVAAEANVRLQDANARIAPAIGVDYGVMQGTLPLYGLSGSIPIPAFNRNQGEREKARATLEQADRLVALATVQVRADVRAAWDAYRTRRASLRRFDGDSAGGILARARSVQESAEFAYRAGGISLVEYLDAQRAFTEIARTYVEAIAQFDRSIVALTAAVGVGGLPRDGRFTTVPR
jgi:cobalt-zinc-cadmium efflux system outer membrane protein